MKDEIAALTSLADGEVPFKYRHLLQRFILDLFKSKSFARAMLYHALKNDHKNAVEVVANQFHVGRATVFRDYAKFKHLF